MRGVPYHVITKLYHFLENREHSLAHLRYLVQKKNLITHNVSISLNHAVFRCVFLCNRWLAVEEDDGMVDRLLPVAIKEDLSKFGHIFFSDTRKRLTDSHLWISIFSRPNKSIFSRVQRLSTVFSLLMMTMLASAMFYRADENVGKTQGYTLGPFKFTLQEVYVSMATSLLVFPVTLLIDQLFRKSRPKIRRKENAFEQRRASSALSKFSVRFSSALRIHTRTQVTPISSDSQSDLEKPPVFQLAAVMFVTDPTSRFASDIINAKIPQPKTGKSPSTLPVRSEEETPPPAVFAKTVRSSPTLFEARHHHTPAPPLFLSGKESDSHTFKKYTPNLTLNYGSSKLDMPNYEKLPPFLPTFGQLTSNQRNSPNVSPKPRCGTPAADSIFSFDSSATEIEDIENMEDNTPVPRMVPPWKKNFVLPHWCVYIAWLLVFVTSSVSATFTFLYSIEWGKEKSIAWLTSMLLAVVESVSIIQPAKVTLFCLLLRNAKCYCDTKIQVTVLGRHVFRGVASYSPYRQRPTLFQRESKKVKMPKMQ